MAIFLVALIPDDDDAIVTLPAGSFAIKEEVDKGDLYSDDDYQDMGLYLARALGRKVHRKGWPKSEPGSTADLLAHPVPDTPPDPGAVAPEVAAVVYPEGACQSCGQALVLTSRGSICPAGCSDDDDVGGIMPAAPGFNTYSATQEAPKPTGMPTGDIIPPTD
jgi:hypothetical protein